MFLYDSRLMHFMIFEFHGRWPPAFFLTNEKEIEVMLIVCADQLGDVSELHMHIFFGIFRVTSCY